MNSMFSLFDAFAAELILGKFVRSSSSVPSFTPKNGSGSVKSLPIKKEEEETKPKNSSMKPRFALEFDGLHCFETLVPN